MCDAAIQYEAINQSILLIVRLCILYSLKSTFCFGPALTYLFHSLCLSFCHLKNKVVNGVSVLLRCRSKSVWWVASCECCAALGTMF